MTPFDSVYACPEPEPLELPMYQVVANPDAIAYLKALPDVVRGLELRIDALVKRCEKLEADLATERTDLGSVAKRCDGFQSTLEDDAGALNGHARRIQALEQSREPTEAPDKPETSREVYSERMCPGDGWRLWWDDGKYQELKFESEEVARSEAEKRGWRIIPGPERTCEVRWDELADGWRVHWPGAISSAWGSIGDAVALAKENGSRVTNDPREVVLRFVEGCWCLCDSGSGKPRRWLASYEVAPKVAREFGWRILREEPASKDYVVVYTGGNCSNPLTLEQAKRDHGCAQAGARIMRLVPIEEPK